MNKKFAVLDEHGIVLAFYADGVHQPEQIPPGAIEISNETHTFLLDGQADGKLMSVLPDGTPTLVDRPAPSIETLRANAWDRIKAERDRRKSGGVLVGGHWIHSDADSRIQWLGIKDSARDLLAAGKDGSEPVLALGQPLRWKTLTGDFMAVTAQLGFDVVEAIKELDARLFETGETKRAEMEAAADPSAYNVLAGWPAAYGDQA